MKPYLEREHTMKRRMEEAGVNTNLLDRWYNGPPAHPEARKIARELAAIDWLYNDDSFGFKFGGEGDNGEFLIDLISLWLELRDAE